MRPTVRQGRGRSGWWALAALLGVLCGVAALPAQAEDDLAPGRLLIADRQLRDPSFGASVVYLITYDDDGTIGLILNRQSDIPISRLLKGVKNARSRKDLAFVGGPLEPDSILALMRARTTPRGAQHVAGQIYAILTQESLEEALAGHAGADKLRLYMGYASWGPGQLEDEISAGAWHILGGSATTVFDPNPGTLWNRMIELTEGTLVRLREPVWFTPVSIRR
jgi:putative transcriptional regulator